MPDLTFNFILPFSNGDFTVPSFPGDHVTQGNVIERTVTLPDPNNDGTLEVGESFFFEGTTQTYRGTVSIDVNGDILTGLLIERDLGGRKEFSIFSDDDLDLPRGTLLSDFTLTEEEFVYCFARGTLIETASGPLAIESLAVGDLVTGADGRVLPIRWIGSTTVPSWKLRLCPNLCPIRFAKGAIGNTRDLTVSPHHRISLSGWRAEVLFGESDVLVAAQDLVNDHTVRRVGDATAVEYWHLLFDRHELIRAEGCVSESLHPAAVHEGAGMAAARDEALTLFPELRNGSQRIPVAGPVIGANDARCLRT